jgi:hypothetical protein
MRKLLFLPIVFMALNAFGQAAPTPPPAAGAPPMNPQQQMQQQQMMDRPDFIVTVQMGTDTLKNGEISVPLTEQTITEMKQAMANPNYTVMLTPRGECGPLNLVSTNPNSFIVKEQKGTSKGIFDYIVVVKQKRPLMPARPQRPGMPGMPGAPGQPGHPGGAAIQH